MFVQSEFSYVCSPDPCTFVVVACILPSWILAFLVAGACANVWQSSAGIFRSDHVRSGASELGIPGLSAVSTCLCHVVSLGSQAVLSRNKAKPG